MLLLDSFVAQAVRDRARGGAMNNVSLGDLSQLEVAIPPLQEQHRIVARVDELMGLLDRLEERLTLTEGIHTSFAAAAVHHLDA